MVDFLPTPDGVYETSKALHEIYGVLHYLVTERIRMDDVFYDQQEKNKF